MSYARRTRLGNAHAARACRPSTTRSGRPGQAHGIADYGSFAMNALRMEKGFKGAGELTNEVTLPEADVMRFVKPDKDDFLGRDNPGRARQAAAVGLRLSGNRAARRLGRHGGEAVRQDGAVVGSTASVAYGHTVGKVLAFAYVKPDAAEPGARLEVFHERKWRRNRAGRGRPTIRRACCRAPTRPRARPRNECVARHHARHGLTGHGDFDKYRVPHRLARATARPTSGFDPGSCLRAQQHRRQHPRRLVFKGGERGDDRGSLSRGQRHGPDLGRRADFVSAHSGRGCVCGTCR
jgi:hypothetical protein